MTRPNELARLALIALALGLVNTACEKDAGTQAATTAAPVKKTPTDERALERSRDRWSKVMKPDLIATYEFLTPEMKAQQPLQSYLQRMGNSVYENMRVHEVAGKKGDLIFLRVGGLWTSVHPMAKRVKLEPGQTLTQDVEFIESWEWLGDDWYYARPYRPEEFAEQFPELQPNYQPPAAKSTQKPVPPTAPPTATTPK
jgi:hypothetical protein